MEKTQKRRAVYAAVLVGLLPAVCGWAQSRLEFPGPAPGKAEARVSPGELTLKNNVLQCTWDISKEQLKPGRIVDKLSETTLQTRQAECFQLVLDGERKLKASDMRIIGEPNLENLQPKRNSSRAAERFAGRQITITLASSDGNLKVQWSAILRDGSNYIRQKILLTTKNEPMLIKEIVLLELSAPKAEVMGIVDGSPVAAGNMFFAYEHPLSKSQILPGNLRRFRCSKALQHPLKPGQLLIQSSVIGVVPQGQLRRGFLYYIERQRAHPYRPFLHYNSWYDIGYGPEQIQQHQALKVVELFAKELIQKRKVRMHSFVWDDGWDDTASLWQFHDRFPDGFAPLEQAARKYDSALGAWLSPFGGYGQAKQQRLKYGRQQGFETNKSGFSLAGPRYFGRFRDVCLNMVREYGLNYFKFDGIGIGGRPTGTNAEFAPDMEALLRLISRLRQAKPDIFVNVTTGTWSSPFWLLYADSTWRSGADWSTHGPGSRREQQITYRDMETYNNVVLRAPLYPINSLMTQGVMFANHGLPNEPDGLVNDIRAFFASGTNCQELYITPSLMQPPHWDALAEAAKWSRDNVDVLVDTHWVGGNPAEGHVYGWAAWSKRKGILSLRNPNDKPGRITIDIAKAFELPTGAVEKYSFKSPWKDDANQAAIVLSAGKTHTFELKPFEVLVFDAAPH